jgi:hypothetical protein
MPISGKFSTECVKSINKRNKRKKGQLSTNPQTLRKKKHYK